MPQADIAVIDNAYESLKPRISLMITDLFSLSK
jgi:hypothetical protein